MIENNEIEIGNVLFVVFEGKKIIYPVIVLEEIIKKSLKGTEVDFVVKAGTGESERVLSLKELSNNNKYFLTTDAARQHLLDLEKIEIDKQVSNALQKAKDWYSYNLNE